MANSRSFFFAFIALSVLLAGVESTKVVSEDSVWSSNKGGSLCCNDHPKFGVCTDNRHCNSWCLKGCDNKKDVARAFLYLAEARVDKRNRERAKRVLRKAMSVSQFFAADIDNNGCVSKAEYVIYKLKEMEKITDKDITPISKQFDKLDGCSNGKITLGDLLDGSSGD